MQRYHYGALAGFIGAAFVFWRFRRVPIDDALPARGTVIFSNTPQPAEP